MSLWCIQIYIFGHFCRFLFASINICLTPRLLALALACGSQVWMLYSFATFQLGKRRKSHVQAPKPAPVKEVVKKGESWIFFFLEFFFAKKARVEEENPCVDTQTRPCSQGGCQEGWVDDVTVFHLIHLTCIFTRMMMLSCGNDTLSLCWKPMLRHPNPPLQSRRLSRRVSIIIIFCYFAIEACLKMGKIIITKSVIFNYWLQVYSSDRFKRFSKIWQKGQLFTTSTLRVLFSAKI